MGEIASLLSQAGAQATPAAGGGSAGSAELRALKEEMLGAVGAVKADLTAKMDGLTHALETLTARLGPEEDVLIGDNVSGGSLI